MAVDASRVDVDPEPPIRTLVVDDHRLFADAVRLTLVDMGLETVEIATTGDEALDVVDRSDPELVIVALDLADTDGLTLGGRIAERGGDTKVVAMARPDRAPLAREAVASGFSGVIGRDIPRDGFERAIRSVLGGEIVTELPAPVRGAGDGDGNGSALATLTGRERQILELLATGASTMAIARRLQVSEHTVRSHIQNILLKLHVRSRLEAATYAVRHGLDGRGATQQTD